LVCSRCAFVARNGRTALRSSFNGYDFAVFNPPDDGELQKICVNFVQNWPIKTVNIFILSGARLSDYIYITIIFV
jgi:hypothetical protein